jgi:hypothetical protein
MERQIGRMAVVKLGVPDVVRINEENREGAVGNMGHRALTIVQVRELDSPLLTEVDLGVLHHHLVSGGIVDVHLFAIMVSTADTGKGEGYCGSESNGER